MGTEAVEASMEADEDAVTAVVVLEVDVAGVEGGETKWMDG